MVESYQWIKAMHLISVFAWMAGMLYLPRLFVYHCAAEPGSEMSETFKVMERRLLRGIMGPAMIGAWGFGLWLLYLSEAWKEHWMMAKFALVIAMTVMHHLFALWRKDFEADRNTRPAKFYRIANEVPTVLLICIVILVIVQPF
jgi:protoporphyrinogen IX oxidase